jgi:hypothetical protein
LRERAIAALVHITFPLAPPHPHTHHLLTARVGKKRRRQEQRWEKDALRDDEYVEMLLDKARKRPQQEVRSRVISCALLPHALLSSRWPFIGSQIGLKGRQPNESMKAFKHRLRQESRELLRANHSANSSSKARRRE